MSNQQIKKIVLRYIRRIERSGIKVTAAYLFGSMAKHTATTNSDIDICIISPIFGKDRFEERLKLMKLREGISDLIEPHPYSVEDLDNRFDALSNEIKKYGIKIQ